MQFNNVFVVVVVVFITLTDRAPTIFTNRKNRKNTARGCQSGSWSAGQGENLRGGNNNPKTTKLMTKKNSYRRSTEETEMAKVKEKWRIVQIARNRKQETGTAPLERI